jgi:F-type H+-transporting ATPase subunit c
MTPQTLYLLMGAASIVVAGLTTAIGAFGAALGESRIGSAAMDALARQPDEEAAITRNLFVTLAMVESTAIFCLVIALILLFANPYTAGLAAR